MAEEFDTAYFQMREAQERQAAAASSSSEARQAHQEMADRYADQCWSLEEGHTLHLPRRAS